MPFTGSSPRERGTRPTKKSIVWFRRFIPARAGNTRVAPNNTECAAVHPRASGEHGKTGNPSAVRTGSSPRERGTPGWRCMRRFPSRFIPARAGNTVGVPARFSKSTVHPRASGEHSTALAPKLWLTGSSPRERGTQHQPLVLFQLARFIPARAGNTRRAWLAPLPAPVHPRASGEHPQVSNPSRSCSGSSPRERGTLFLEGIVPKPRFTCQ